MPLRQKPRVYAIHMEAVLAFGQDPTLFPLLELRQAHGAFRRKFLIFRLVDEGRNRAHSAGVEAPGGGGNLRRRGGGGERGDAAKALVGAAAAVDVECDDDEAGEEEDGDG